MKTLNTVAFIMVLLWVAGWTVAALRAGFKSTVLPCPVRRGEGTEEEYLGS